MSQTTKNNLFLQFDGPSHAVILKTYPHSRSINNNMREAVTHSQRLWITLRYLASGNNFEDKFIRVTGITVLETCLLLGSQAVTERILRNTVHRLFNILHNITTTRSITLCNITARLGVPYQLAVRMFRIQKVEAASSSGPLVPIYPATWRHVPELSVFFITQCGYFTTIHHDTRHMVRNTVAVNNKSKYCMYWRSLYKNGLCHLFWKSRGQFAAMRRDILRNSLRFPPTRRERPG
jgi:hypothetical protein